MGMIFGKYQYRESEIQRRGYSETVGTTDANGNRSWAKWVLGINKEDDRTNAYADGLRRLQHAKHSNLPAIVDFGFDEERKAFVVIHEYLNEARPLEGCCKELSRSVLIAGLKDMGECLSYLHAKFHIAHGDIHPGNILVDHAGQFHLIDLGLANMTRSLSQEADIEVFATHFSAPEKHKPGAKRGYPWQSDVYSLGRTIEWMGQELPLDWNEGAQVLLQEMLALDPADRPMWPMVLDRFKHFGGVLAERQVSITFDGTFDPEVFPLLAASPPRFKVGPRGNNVILDVIIGSRLYTRVLWLLAEKRLKLFDWKEREPRYESEFKSLPSVYAFIHGEVALKADLTPLFKKWEKEGDARRTTRGEQKRVREKLTFFKQLLERELEEIEKKAFRVKYVEVRQDSKYSLRFKVKRGPEFDSSVLSHHLNSANRNDAEGFRYIASASGNIKERNGNVELSGRPIDFDKEHGWLTVVDCEGADLDRIPAQGALMQNTRMDRVEKERQLSSLKAVESGDVHNPRLIHALFNPGEVPPQAFDPAEELTVVHQRNAEGLPLKYSYDQRKAIRQALEVKPLNVIQGPPGTGKTTVITEVVFQLLSARPGTKVLITSQTNNAVDQVLENLVRNGIPVLRLKGANSAGSKAMSDHTLENKIIGWRTEVQGRAKAAYKRLMDQRLSDLSVQHPLAIKVAELLVGRPSEKELLRDMRRILGHFKGLPSLDDLPAQRTDMITWVESALQIDLQPVLLLADLHSEWSKTLEMLKEDSAVNDRIIDTIRVIGATCNHIAAGKYVRYGFNFDHIIMDESGKATMAETLVPVTMGQNLIFVGDHRQLRPSLTQNRAVEKWLRELYKSEAEGMEGWDEFINRPSLFEDVIGEILPIHKTQLTDCRRSSYDQVIRTSTHFYEVHGDEPLRPVDRPREKEHQLSLAVQTSIVFVDIGNEHKYQVDKQSKSSYNTLSAQAILDLLDALDAQPQVSSNSVGVIVPYTAQWEILQNQLKKKGSKAYSNLGYSPAGNNDRFKLSVLDGFQGLEADIMIVDLVKSGPDLDLGFLEVPNRINVALSRQKQLLVLVGDRSGLLSARTRRTQGRPAALQNYMESIPKEWVVDMKDIKAFFQ